MTKILITLSQATFRVNHQEQEVPDNDNDLQAGQATFICLATLLLVLCTLLRACKSTNTAVLISTNVVTIILITL